LVVGVGLALLVGFGVAVLVARRRG